MPSITNKSFSLQKIFTEVLGAIPHPNLGISDIISYKEENQLLRQRVMQYALLNAELAETARENERLREMLQLARESQYQLRAAEVISRGASSVLNTVTLNVGTEDGIEPNFPVLVGEGFLLGKTTMSVAANASVVQLVTDRNFRLSVKVGDQGIRGILVPLYDQFAEITGIPPNSDIRLGDRVLTSGFSDIYPRDIPVGIVEEVSTIPGENFMRVRINLHAKPSDIDFVFVMIGHDTDN